MGKGKGKGTKSQVDNKVLPEGVEVPSGAKPQLKGAKLSLYHHFRIEEQNVDALKEKFATLYARSADLACRNLIETLLMALELRDYAEKAFEPEFWQQEPSQVIDIDTFKNIKASEIVFRKDKMFRDRVLKFYFETAKVMAQGILEPGAEQVFLQFIQWLMFLTKVPVRELRKVAVEIALEAFGGLLKVASDLIDGERKSKDKLPETFAIIINFAYKYYMLGLLKEKTKDVDVSIRSSVLDHIFQVYRGGVYYTVDEGVVIFNKRNKRNLHREVEGLKQGSLTLLSLTQVFECLRDSDNNSEKILRSLQKVPATIEEMAKSCLDSDLGEWRTEGALIVKKNLEQFTKHKEFLKKYMIEEKDEIGAIIISLFRSMCSHAQTGSILDETDLRETLILVTSMKKKVKEAAIEFMLDRIETKAADDHSHETEERRTMQFLEMFHGVNIEIAEKITKDDEELFDESKVICRLEPFKNKLHAYFDGKILCELFLSSEKNSANPTMNAKGYLGCLLYSVLGYYQTIMSEEPSGKSEQEKEYYDKVKGIVVSIKTRIKEEFKKSLLAKTLQFPDLLRLHLKLIEMVCTESDDDLHELVLTLYERTVEPKTLRLASNILRNFCVKLQKESLIRSEQFAEKIRRLYTVQIDSLEAAVGKVKKEVEKNGKRKLRDDKKLTEELRVTLRKVTLLRENFKTSFQIKDSYLEDAEFLMNLYVDETLADREILERVIVLLTTNTSLLMTNLGNLDGPAKFAKYRDSMLEYLLNLLNPRSLPQLSASDAIGVRRFAFLHLLEILRVVMDDRIHFRALELRPEPEMVERIWEFISVYCFKSASAVIEDESTENRPRYSPTSGEKRTIGGLDEEKPNDNEAGDAANGGAEQSTGLYLRYSDYNFTEDVLTLVAVVFRNCIHMLRSIGITLITRLLASIYELKKDQEHFIKIIERNLLEPLILEEKKHPINPTQGTGPMIFWRLVQSCFDLFHLGLMKIFSKSVMTIFKKHLNPDNMDDVLRVNYRAMSFRMLQTTYEATDTMFSIEKLFMFLKKPLLGDRFCNKMLFSAMGYLDTIKSNGGKDKELENINSPKYLHVKKIVQQLMLMCQKQYKEDEAAALEATGTKGRRASSKSPAPPQRESTKIVDENAVQNNSDQKENAQRGKSKRGAKGKATKNQPTKPADEPTTNSRSGSPQSRRGSQSSSASPQVKKGKKITGPKSKGSVGVEEVKSGGGKSKQTGKGGGKTRRSESPEPEEAPVARKQVKKETSRAKKNK